jgi:tetraacyldisaccharide 4'-kinase
LILITRKSATFADAEAAAATWSAFAGAPETVIVHLEGGDLRGATPDREAERVAAKDLRGKRVLAISAIGAPTSFEAQLTAMGAAVESASYGDHHDFTGAEVQGLTERAGKADLVVCTLKDAVKLGPLWPRQAPPLWYLSQAVVVERGADLIDAALSKLL